MRKDYIMQKWEYSVLRHTSGSMGSEVVYIGPDGVRKKVPLGEEDILKELNKLGVEGWEVASYGNAESMGGIYRETWTLKRPKK